MMYRTRSTARIHSGGGRLILAIIKSVRRVACFILGPATFLWEGSGWVPSLLVGGVVDVAIVAILLFNELGSPRGARNTCLKDKALPELLEKSIGGQFQTDFV